MTMDTYIAAFFAVTTIVYIVLYRLEASHNDELQQELNRLKGIEL